MEIRLKTLSGTTSGAIASVVNAASANGLKLIGFEQRSGRLEDVFAGLASPAQKKEAEACITE